MDDNTWLAEGRIQKIPMALAVGFLFARLTGLLTMNLAGMLGYGDISTYFAISDLPGWPFLDYWVEYPPIFPFLSEVLFRISGGQEHVFAYLLIFLLILADSGSVYFFSRQALRWYPPVDALVRSGIYMLVLLPAAYSWWYFDALVVFWALFGLSLMVEDRTKTAGLVLSVGVALKLFPVLIVLAGWRERAWKRTALTGLLSVLPLFAMYALLFRISPDFTMASLQAQASKGSWETIWALLDGNLSTGSFGPLVERFDSSLAAHMIGNHAVIPPAVSLFVFGAIGLWVFARSRLESERQSAALVGFGWSLFLLWSPGWSPQWMLYLLPLILLILPVRISVLMSVVFILVNLLEWPILLSRGFFSLLWVTIMLRTLLLVILTAAFYLEMGAKQKLLIPDGRGVRPPTGG